MKKRVQFDAHRIVKLPTEIGFKTRDGREVEFIARKKTKVPVRVKFDANVKRT